MSDSPVTWDPHATPERERVLNLKRPVLDYFPQELIDLRIEIQKHPPLLLLLHEQADKDVYIQLMEIATYCKILVTGEYTRDDMLQLCKMLTAKLMDMRSIVIVPFVR